VRRALLGASLVLAALAAPTPARTIAVVLDRSGSLRHADPDGRAPRLLGLAVALAARPGDALAVFPTRGEPRPAIPLPADPAAAARALAAVLEAPPRSGGADLLEALDRARAAAGPDGLVLVLTDDDLDVVEPGGGIPPAVRERLPAGGRPTRDQVNAAAADLLEARAAAPGPPVVALRAPLPTGARATPFLQRIGAELVELEGDELAVAAELVARVRGEPLLAQRVALPAGAGALELDYPARVVLLAARPLEVPGAHRLAADGTAWLAETPGRLALPAGHPPLTAFCAPDLGLPAEVVAYRLRDGRVRVVAAGAEPPATGELVVRYRAEEVPLTGTPPRAHLAPQVLVGEVEEVTLLRRLDVDGRRVVAASRRIPLTRAEVVLRPEGGPAETGVPLTLRGPLPLGLAPEDPGSVRVREASGAGASAPLEVAGDELIVRYTPQAEGPLTLESEGELYVRLAAPVEVGPGQEYRLVVAGLRSAETGRELSSEEPVLLEAGARLALIVEVAVEPALPGEVSVDFVLAGGPAAATVEAEPATLRERLEHRIVLTWPEAREGRVTLRVVAREGTGIRGAGRSFTVVRPPSLLRYLVAGGLLLGALLWALVIVLRRRAARRRAEAERTARKAATARRVGRRQIRGVGGNGRMSVERYAFLEHSREDDEQVHIRPDESAVGVQFDVREDGAVRVRATDGAKIIHEDRPTILSDEASLQHGTAFAVVDAERRARRYVYLEDEPTGDELQRRYVADAASYEAEMRDSGVFVVLDDDQNVPAGVSGRLDDISSGDQVFPAAPSGVEEILDSRDESMMPSSADDQLVSDEGIVFMSSDEAEILDSDEVERLADTDIGATAETQRAPQQAGEGGGDAEVDEDLIGSDLVLGELSEDPGEASDDPGSGSDVVGDAYSDEART